MDVEVRATSYELRATVPVPYLNRITSPHSPYSAQEYLPTRNQLTEQPIYYNQIKSNQINKRSMYITKQQLSILCLSAAAFNCNVATVTSFTIPHPHRSLHHMQSTSLASLEEAQAEVQVQVQAAAVEPPMSTASDDNLTRPERPQWMQCVNGIASKTGSLNAEVSRLAGVSLAQANDLIELGAVWAKMDLLTEQDILNQYSGVVSATESAKVLYGDLPSGWHSDRFAREDVDEEDLDDFVRRMEGMRYNRIMTPSTVASGTDLRVYPFPRRFPSCKDLDDTKLLHEDTTFVIVDKPPMLPTQPDASNYFENCPGCVATNIGSFTNLAGEEVERLMLCHRVDSCVSGCVVLSKDENGQAVFSQLQQDRKVKKVYKAVTKNLVPVGMHVHWMWGAMSKRGKTGGPACQLVSHEVPLNRKKAKAWTRCILEVVKSEPIIVDKDNVFGYDPGMEQHYESTIRLVTGRKHQVRTMLSSLGAPIIRDTLYEPIAGMTLDMLYVDGDEAELMDMAVQKCRVPTHPIGLQAHAIMFGGIRAKAGKPWWGDGGNGGY